MRSTLGLNVSSYAIIQFLPTFWHAIFSPLRETFPERQAEERARSPATRCHSPKVRFLPWTAKLRSERYANNVRMLERKQWKCLTSSHLLAFPVPSRKLRILSSTSFRFPSSLNESGNFFVSSSENVTFFSFLNINIAISDEY